MCGTKVDLEGKHSSKLENYKVRTIDFGESIVKTCNERRDEWSFVVSGRIGSFVSDLHAADCVYHQSCSVNFRTGKQIPSAYDSELCNSKRSKVGRPICNAQYNAFLETCDYIETNVMEDKQVTLLELTKLMESYLVGTNLSAYTVRYMKKQLIDFFGNRIFITNTDGLTDILTLRETAHDVLREYYQKPKDVDIELQKIMIIETAAKIIKNDIRSTAEKSDSFPGTDNLTNSAALHYLPESLKLLLSKMFSSKNKDRKVGSIGQAIMQAACPRSLLAPLQIGLAVQLYHHFRSRYLIDTLHSLGFSTSYNNAQQFERNAATVSSTLLPVTNESQVVMVADNVDHNVCTLDGMNTIHAMGMIAAVTPSRNSITTVTRRKITNDELLQHAKIAITEQHQMY